MAALSWVRVSRRFTSFIRQKELPNLEAWLDAEARRQPAYTYFILSCAIPAGIGIFGFGTVFVSWITGNTGIPIIIGTAVTIILAAITWFIFFRLHQSVSPLQRQLRKLVAQFTARYASFSNMIVGENPMSEEFANLIDRAAAIYNSCSSPTFANHRDFSPQVVIAMEKAMIKLIEVAVLNDKDAENQALAWAAPLVDELELVHQALINKSQELPESDTTDPLANLRSIRIDIESQHAAEKELDHHISDS